MSMTLIHSAQTELAAAAESDPLLNLAGAFFIASAHREDPDLWVPVSAEKLDKILSDENEDRRSLHVLGNSEELILRELYSRFPAKYGCRIRRYEDFTRHKAEKHYSCGHRHKWKEIKVPVVWVKLSRPYLAESEVESREQLERIVQEIGPVLLEEDTVRHLFPTDGVPSSSFLDPTLSACVEFHGFVALERAKLDLWQISYNPDVPRQRRYRQAVAAYEKRMEGELPEELRHALMAHLSPDRWYCHPYSRANIRGPKLYKYPGWNHQVPIEFSVSEVLTLRDFNLKLDKRPWWREGGRNGPSEFKSTVEKCLTYVHGIEAEAKALAAEQRRQLQRDYEAHAESVRQHNANPTLPLDPENPWQPRVLESFETFCRLNSDSYKGEEIRRMHDLCRWLRREARALKLAMPKPPRQPKPPRKVRHGKIR